MNTNNFRNDGFTTLIKIEFEHDGRMCAEEAREYIKRSVIDSAIAVHSHTIDNGTHLLNVEDLGEPQPVPRPSFYDVARDIIEHYENDHTDRDVLGASIAEDISRAVVQVLGKGRAARYLLDVISNRVQSWCNPALNDDDEDEIPAF